jgi:integrase
MAKLTIRITHVSWRDGRPRFNPGPSLRALGYKRGEDLRNADGSWFTAEQALAWADKREQEIEARRAAKAAGKRLARVQPGRAHHITIEELFDAFFASPRMKGESVTEGRRNQKGVSAATIRDYKQKREALTKFDPLFAGSPVEAIRRAHVYDVFERMWEKHGLATARGAVRVLSAAITWGMNRGRVKLEANPCMKLNMQTPDARVRCGLPAEIRALVTAADDLGWREIGDSIVMGVWTGQRQKDRLELQDAGLVDGRRVFRQSKTKAIVEIAPAPELEARLAAARLRRKDWPVQRMNVIVNERTRLPFVPDTYRHAFAEVRAHAAKTMASVADLRDQDLRDTAVTWLARAGCTLPEICKITGHAMASATQVLEHYLSQHRELGDNAIEKLLTWYAKQDMSEGAGE